MLRDKNGVDQKIGSSGLVGLQGWTQFIRPNKNANPQEID